MTPFIEEWFSRWPSAGWGIRLDVSGLVIVDVDPRNGGSESLSNWEKEHGPFPATLTAKTGGGGLHLYFNDPLTLPPKTNIEVLPGLEILSGRHIAILAPSLHKSGSRYRWQNNHDIADLPSVVITTAHDLVADAIKKKGLATAGSSGGQVISQRWSLPADPDRQKLYERARTYLNSIPPGIQGKNGSSPTYNAACKLVLGFDFNKNEAMPLLQEYSARCDPPWPDDQLLHKLDDANKEPGERGYLLNGSRYGRLEQELAELNGIEIEYILPGPRGSRQKTPTPSEQPEPWTEEENNKLADVLATNPSNQISIAGPAGPPAENKPRRSHIPGCHLKVFCQHRTTAKAAVFYVSCMSWDCLDCARRLKELWTSNVRKRLADDQAELDEPNGFVYLAHCKSEHWSTLHKRIRRRRGNYFRVRDGDGFLIAATVDPGGAQELSHEAAGDALVKVIASLPLCQKPISSSRAWKLPKEEETKQWKRLGEVPREVTTQRIRRILHETGLKPVDIIVQHAQTLRHILQFDLPKDWTQAKLDDFYWFLCQGETLPPDNLDFLPLRRESTHGGDGSLDLTVF